MFEIDQQAFKGWTSLRTISFADACAIKKLGDQAFASTALEMFAFPSSLRQIGTGLFQDCKMLKTVSLGAGLKFVGDSWFSRSGIQSIAFPASVVEVQTNAFLECENLEKVTFPKNSQLQKICFGAFRGAGIRNFTAPSSLRHIAQSAFCKCKKLKSVTLNEGLVELGDDTFFENGNKFYGVF